MSRILLALALVLASLGATAQQSTISTQATAATDAQITTRLRDILSELGGYEDIRVEVEDGVVHLYGTATSLAEVNDLNALAQRIEGVVAVTNDVTETTDLARRLNPALERFSKRAEQALIALPIVLIALVVFAVIQLFGLWIASWRRPWDRMAPNAFIANLFRQLVRLSFFVIGVVVALDILNATALLSTILGAAGIIGLAVGFAIRDTVENFIASVLLSIRQPFAPNDTIEINGDIGKVIRLTSRATILLSLDGNHIRIPNATVFKSRIVNYSRNPERRFQFEIGVASDADLAHVIHLAEDTLHRLPFVLREPAPDVWIDRIGDGAILLQVTAWIDQQETAMTGARGEALRQVKAAIEAEDVEVPDTTYRIQLLGGAPAPLPAQHGPAEPPAHAKADPAHPEDVSAEADRSLERIVEKERQEEATPDLLDEDALKE
ncbi:MAG: mechanosensitive ion channel protein MscS [Rhodobacterales bacterium]|nr:MAG: mechanosensitive ion channel protein MscS [Rhodobacterales bacterium]